MWNSYNAHTKTHTHKDSLAFAKQTCVVACVVATTFLVAHHCLICRQKKRTQCGATQTLSLEHPPHETSHTHRLTRQRPGTRLSLGENKICGQYLKSCETPKTTCETIHHIHLVRTSHLDNIRCTHTHHTWRTMFSKGGVFRRLTWNHMFLTCAVANQKKEDAARHSDLILVSAHSTRGRPRASFDAPAPRDAFEFGREKSCGQYMNHGMHTKHCESTHMHNTSHVAHTLVKHSPPHNISDTPTHTHTCEAFTT